MKDLKKYHFNKGITQEEKDQLMDKALSSYGSLIKLSYTLEKTINSLEKAKDYASRDCISKVFEADNLQAVKNVTDSIIRLITERLERLEDEDIEVLHDYYEERLTPEQFKEKYSVSMNQINYKLKEIRGILYAD